MLQQSYVVKFIADDLGIASVVVSVGHSEFQRPEQTVEDLNIVSTNTVRCYYSVNSSHLYYITNDTFNDKEDILLYY